MPKFVVMSGSFAMKVIVDKVIFIEDARQANTYPSKYAARRHIKQLDNVPENVTIVEIKQVEEI